MPCEKKNVNEKSTEISPLIRMEVHKNDDQKIAAKCPYNAIYTMKQSFDIVSSTNFLSAGILILPKNSNDFAA